MKLAPNADRKVIEKVLRMADKRQKIEGTLNKSLQPDAKDVVDKWLLGANDTGIEWNYIHYDGYVQIYISTLMSESS